MEIVICCFFVNCLIELKGLYKFNTFLSLRHFALRQNATVSLRRRAGSALTVPRTVIHSLAAASLPSGKGFGLEFFRFATHRRRSTAVRYPSPSASPPPLPAGRGLVHSASLPLQGEVLFVQTKEFAQSKAPSLGGVSRCSRDGVGLKDK